MELSFHTAEVNVLVLPYNSSHKHSESQRGPWGTVGANLRSFLPVPEEEQETSGDFGSGGGSVVLLDDLDDERELGPKDKEGKLRVHTRAVREDDEDEDDDKDDEVGYIW